jgi:membrane protease YdiL (CAAX protease family)
VALSALAWVLAYGAGVVVVIILAIFAARLLGTGRPPVAAPAFAILAGTALAALAAVRIHLLRRRGLRWADVGLRRPDRSPLHLAWQIPAVMGGGAVASMLVLIPLGLGGDAAEDPTDVAITDLFTGGPVVVLLGLLTVAVIVPIAEEVIFRGIVLPALRARHRAPVGITLAGAVFAAVHFVPPALPYLLVVGIALCAMAEWYRSIVPGIVLHGVNNAIVAGTVLAGAGAL